jgi:hypothetical protein
MTDPAPTTNGDVRPLPQAREVVIGTVIGLAVGIALWMLILQLFGGASHHFSFGP